MKRIHIITASLLLFGAFTSCRDINERDIYPGSGLGAPDKTFDVGSAEGELTIPVIASEEYAIRPQADWIGAPATGPAGRDGFTLTYSYNDGIPRVGKVILAIDHSSHYDTLTIRQRGEIVPRLACDSTTLCLKGSQEGSFSIKLDTNLDDDMIAITTDFESTDYWVSDVAVNDGTLSFSYTANSGENMRRASIKASFTDGWGDIYSIHLMVSQTNRDDSPGTAISFAELFALASEDGETIENDVVIEGIVVSDPKSGNTGDNTQISITSIDYDVCRETIYLEAPDGSAGVMIRTKTPDDNPFCQGDLLKLSLRGAKIRRSQVLNAATDPVYYSIENVTGNMVYSRKALGKEGIPEKKRYISELTDADIFTYVSLQYCELPVRKGPMTPVSEQFTSACGADKVAKFGILLRDIQGSSMYVYTNTTCPYRRDGRRLPYGSGTMKGVIVHENFHRFKYMDNASEDENTWGNIGRYQIRHTCREDFAMADEMTAGTSFSGIICEWRYILSKNLEKYFATDGDRNAYFTYSFTYPNSSTYIADGRAGKLPINMYTDYSYLGPCSSTQTGNANGAGVILQDGTDWMAPNFPGTNGQYAKNANSKGYGDLTASTGSAWSTNLTARNGEAMYTTLVFSTKGITSNRMSMQISSMNYFYSSTQAVNGIQMFLAGPRYWKVEWSLDNKEWTLAGKYTLPDFCQSTPMTQVWQTPGYMAVDIPLPAEALLDQNEVYIRIIPESLVTGSQTDYIDNSIVYPNAGSFPTAWNYIGIRYNTTSNPPSDIGGGDIEDMGGQDYNW